jgi:hypothetical protein
MVLQRTQRTDASSRLLFVGGRCIGISLIWYGLSVMNRVSAPHSGDVWSLESLIVDSKSKRQLLNNSQSALLFPTRMCHHTSYNGMDIGLQLPQRRLFIGHQLTTLPFAGASTSSWNPAENPLTLNFCKWFSTGLCLVSNDSSYGGRSPDLVDV